MMPPGGTKFGPPCGLKSRPPGGTNLRPPGGSTEGVPGVHVSWACYRETYMCPSHWLPRLRPPGGFKSWPPGGTKLMPPGGTKLGPPGGTKTRPQDGIKFGPPGGTSFLTSREQVRSEKPSTRQARCGSGGTTSQDALRLGGQLSESTLMRPRCVCTSGGERASCS